MGSGRGPASSATFGRPGIAEPLRFTAAFTKGGRVHAVRYATDEEPPTLYTRTLPCGSGMLIVSEPLDEARDGWNAVPPQHLITVTSEKIESSPVQIASDLEQVV